MMQLHSVPGSSRSYTVEVRGGGGVKMARSAQGGIVIDFPQSQGVGSGILSGSRPRSSSETSQSWLYVLDRHGEQVDRRLVKASYDERFINSSPHLIGLYEKITNRPVSPFKWCPCSPVMVTWWWCTCKVGKIVLTGIGARIILGLVHFSNFGDAAKSIRGLRNKSSDSNSSAEVHFNDRVKVGA